MAKNEGSKRPFKEKIVQLYEAFFRGEDPSCDNSNFWDEFFLLRANLGFLVKKFEDLSYEELSALKETVNNLFYQCVQILKDGNQIRAMNSLQTLCALVHGVFAKNHIDYGFDIINILIGFSSADHLMQTLIEQLSHFLCLDYPATLKSLSLKFFLILVTATENVSQNTLLEYLMMNSAFEAIIQVRNLNVPEMEHWHLKLLKDTNSRQYHGYDALLLLTTLVNYRKHEAANPYIVKLSIIDDEMALNGFGQVVSLALSDFNRKFCEEELKPHSSFLSSFSSFVESMFISEEADLDHYNIKANNAVLLALYEAVHLNRNFLITLTHCQVDASGQFRAPSLMELPDVKTPSLVHDDSNLPPSNLLVTFLEFSSIIMLNTKDKSEPVCQSSHCYESKMPLTMQDRAFLVKCYYECDSNERCALQRYRSVTGIRLRPMTLQGLRKMMVKFEATGLLSVAPGWGKKPASLETEETVALAMEEATMESTHDESNMNTCKLCFIIFTCITEDQYANSIIHDVNLVYKVQLHRMPMRHRKVSFERYSAYRPLACPLLDLMVEFILSHLTKCLPFELYHLCLGVIHRILCYQKKTRVRLQYNWKELWTALISLVKFLVTQESLLAKNCNIFHLSIQVMNVLNLFITFGDTFLPSPSCYDELYYEVIRMNIVFDNLYSLTLRYTTTDGEWKEFAAKLMNSLVNIRAIINHFTPKIDSVLSENNISALTEEQVLEVVRNNYDTLTLKLYDNLDQFERYTEKPIETAFFTPLVRSVISDFRRSLNFKSIEMQSVLKEFSMIS